MRHWFYDMGGLSQLQQQVASWQLEMPSRRRRQRGSRQNEGPTLPLSSDRIGRHTDRVRSEQRFRSERLGGRAAGPAAGSVQGAARAAMEAAHEAPRVPTRVLPSAAAKSYSVVRSAAIPSGRSLHCDGMVQT